MKVQPAEPGLRARKKEQTRRDLRESAARLFAARGFAATTVADIAAAANVSERTFFRYFEGKEALLPPDSADLFAHIEARLAARPADGDPLTVVSQALLAAAEPLTASGPAAVSRPPAGAEALAAGQLVKTFDGFEDRPAALIEQRPPPPTPDRDLHAAALACASLSAVRAVLRTQRTRRRRHTAGAAPRDAHDPAGAAPAGQPAIVRPPAVGSPGRPSRRFLTGRPRLRRRLVLTAGVAVTAVVVAGVGDLLLEHTARERIAHAAACRLSPTGPVSAQLSGALPGLRLLTGELGTIHISADDVRRDGTRLTVSADLHDVTTKGATSGGSATATIAFTELRKRLGGEAAGLAPGSDGDGGLVLTGRLAGLPLPVVVHTRITTTADSLTVAPTEVSLLGRVFPVNRLAASPATAGLAQRLAPRTVTLPAMPRGVRVTGVRAGHGGLVLTAALPRSDGSATSYEANGCDHEGG